MNIHNVGISGGNTQLITIVFAHGQSTQTVFQLIKIENRYTLVENSKIKYREPILCFNIAQLLPKFLF